MAALAPSGVTQPLMSPLPSLTHFRFFFCSWLPTLRDPLATASWHLASSASAALPAATTKHAATSADTSLVLLIVTPLSFLWWQCHRCQLVCERRRVYGDSLPYPQNLGVHQPLGLGQENFVRGRAVDSETSVRLARNALPGSFCCRTGCAPRVTRTIQDRLADGPIPAGIRLGVATVDRTVRSP